MWGHPAKTRVDEVNAFLTKFLEERLDLEYILKGYSGAATIFR